jgi:hypothetical protein
MLNVIDLLTHIFFIFLRIYSDDARGRFPIESQVGLSRVIASNSAKLVKGNFWGITVVVG